MTEHVARVSIYSVRVALGTSVTLLTVRHDSGQMFSDCFGFGVVTFITTGFHHRCISGIGEAFGVGAQRFSLAEAGVFERPGIHVHGEDDDLLFTPLPGDGPAVGYFG